MKRVKILAVLNLVFFVVACAISNLSQLRIFNNQDNAQVSAKYETVFTPAGFTFAVWGVIYISLLIFVIYHVIKAFSKDLNHEANQNILKINYWFILNNIATSIWVFAFAYEYIFLSAILLTFQLITLTVIFVNLNLYNPDTTVKSVWFTQFPLSIYFGWICIATIANITLFLVSINWIGGGLSALNWTIILLVIATLLGLFLVLIKRNSFVGLIFMWAFYGILYKRTSINAELYSSVIAAAWLGIALLGLAILLNVIRHYKPTKSA